MFGVGGSIPSPATLQSDSRRAVDSGPRRNACEAACVVGLKARTLSANLLHPMKRYLPFAIITLVALITLCAGTLFYRAHSLPPSLAATDVPKAKEGGEAMHVLGPANAPVTIEEFGDFQCPPCGQLAAPLHQLVEDFRPKVRLIFRELPLPMHAHAREAALAAEAAGLQGKFWQMHELLYREQATWTKAADARPLLSAYAGIIGLKLDRFRQDIDGAETSARLDADNTRASVVEAKVTPTVFINGSPIGGTALNPAGLRAAIEAALASKPTGN